MTIVFPHVDPEPLWVVVLFAIMLLAAEGGYQLSRVRATRTADGVKSHANLIVGATLGLLALLISFSLSMAVARFDGRRQLLLAEANEIATSYVWASLLPSPEGREIGERLRQCVALRLDAGWHSRTAAAELTQGLEDLHREIWLLAAVLSRRNANLVPLNQFVLSLKELVGLHERLLSAFESQVPGAVLVLLGTAAVGSSFLVGYGSGLHGGRNGLATAVYAMLVCLVLLVIVDLDRPRHGLIQVSERSLERLQRQLGPMADLGSPVDRFAGLKAVRYRCDDGQDVLATFIKIDPPVARIERADTRWILPLRISASGARYS
jgi:Membrane-bound lysozyme-inhibitor of c-type lysozyme